MLVPRRCVAAALQLLLGKHDGNRSQSRSNGAKRAATEQGHSQEGDQQQIRGGCRCVSRAGTDTPLYFSGVTKDFLASPMALQAPQRYFLYPNCTLLPNCPTTTSPRQSY